MKKLVDWLAAEVAAGRLSVRAARAILRVAQ
jgi:hypothetical protein